MLSSAKSINEIDQRNRSAKARLSSAKLINGRSIKTVKRGRPLRPLLRLSGEAPAHPKNARGTTSALFSRSSRESPRASLERPRTLGRLQNRSFLDFARFLLDVRLIVVGTCGDSSSMSRVYDVLGLDDRPLRYKNPKSLKIFENIQTLPIASGCIPMGANGSVRTRRKASKNFAKTSKNLANTSKNFAKIFVKLFLTA